MLVSQIPRLQNNEFLANEQRIKPCPREQEQRFATLELTLACRDHAGMADIFVSYTKSDRDWAFWLAEELKDLGHRAHIHEREIHAGDDIYAWMEGRYDAADHVLCVVSDDYLKEANFYSQLERRAALWQAAGKRPRFAILVVVKRADRRRSAIITGTASCSACRDEPQ
jgi:hypothetical protein